ncbi:MAG: hypothetical protein WD009_04705 [Phycisphaeraceae bacterium]
MRSTVILTGAALGWLLLGCEQEPSRHRPDPDYERQVEEVDRQLEHAARQLEEYDHQLQRSVAQSERLDALLNRWEEQADRYDAVLDAWEEQAQQDGR